MPEYAPGTPSWIDLGTPDPDASARFYGELFGWQAVETGSEEETGGYRMFQQGEARIAGLMKLMQEGQPPAWSTYISVDDADATAAAVTDNGGSVLAGPMDVLDIGRMAVFADPTGAVFGIWQPKSFKGADLVNEPVSLIWNEVHTRDPEGAQAFYTAVFGWEPGPGPEGVSDYTTWNVDGRAVGGMMPMAGRYPEDVPPHWAVCFAVADTDATAAKAKELGGTVVAEPMDMPSLGRFAGIVDPQGAAFAVMQFARG